MPGTVVVWDSVVCDSVVAAVRAMAAAAAVELAVVTVSLLRDATVGDGDILALDNGLLRVGGRRRNGVRWMMRPMLRSCLFPVEVGKA